MTFDDKLWILGGYNAIAATPQQDGAEGNRNDVWFSPDGVKWTEVPHTGWRPTHAGTPFVFGGDLFYAPGNDIWYETRQDGDEVAHWHPAELWRLNLMRAVNDIVPARL